MTDTHSTQSEESEWGRAPGTGHSENSTETSHRIAAGESPGHVCPWTQTMRETIRPLKVGSIHALLPGRLSFVVFTSDDMTWRYIRENRKLFFFSSDFQEQYEPFCLDFGPVNLSVVHSFCACMRKYWQHPQLQGRELVYYCTDQVNERTNTAFLLAAFMVCDLGMTPEEAWAHFGRIGAGDAFAEFRDATFCEQTYGLSILACLQGLHKAKSMGWYDPETFHGPEYEYLDNPRNADMHVLSPKFVAFKGPTCPATAHTFLPRHYVEVFKDKDVTAVVRLNKPTTYSPEDFTREGFRHYDLYFDDCTVPEPVVVDKFLEICEAEQGRVAVHCQAGLGRTGTLIAVYFMAHHGWTASECIGWLRIVRPGSVIGPQQQWLHWAEGVYRNRKSARSTHTPAQPDAFQNDLSIGQSEALGEQVAAAQNSRGSRVCAHQNGSAHMEPARPANVDVRQPKSSRSMGKDRWTRSLAFSKEFTCAEEVLRSGANNWTGLQA